MRKIFVIGIGTGNPEHLTLQAIAALQQLDVVFVLDKGETKADLLALRKRICERHLAGRPHRIVELADPVRDPSVSDYKTRVAQWHRQRAAIYADAFREALGENERGGVLAWGDPALYDSTLRLLEQLQAESDVPFDFEVIPGISSLSALAASHRIPLNRIGTSILVTTGRRLSEEGMPANADDVVVMLDGQCSFQALPPDDLEIYWGAYLGTEHELLCAGPLRERSAEIANLRNAARERHGWIMDIYLLRKSRASRDA